MGHLGLELEERVIHAEPQQTRGLQRNGLTPVDREALLAEVTCPAKQHAVVCEELHGKAGGDARIAISKGMDHESLSAVHYSRRGGGTALPLLGDRWEKVKVAKVGGLAPKSVTCVWLADNCRVWRARSRDTKRRAKLIEQGRGLVPGIDGTATRVLLAEDDEMLARFVGDLLVREGYQVEHAANGPAVLSKVSGGGMQLLVLDLNLPDLDGLHVLRQLRLQDAKLPVLVLTARSRTDGLLPALESGADDCMLKPFSYLELLARVRALLRRQSPAAEVASRCGDLMLHRQHSSVKRGDCRIELTQREFALLEYLMRTPEVPVSRAVLLQEIWGAACESSTNIVDVYMKYVRDKVDLPGLPKLVRTVRGTGYMVSAA